MSEEKINSHDTMVFATDREKNIVFFKSYEYFKQKDEAQNDFSYAMELAKKIGGAYYISTIAESSRWEISANGEEDYKFKIADPKKLKP